MRMMSAFAAVLYSAAAFAQSSTAPAADAEKPAAEAKPAMTAKTAKGPKTKGSIAVRLQACQDIEDGTKGRLDCYDAVLPPAKPKAGAAKCRTRRWNAGVPAETLQAPAKETVYELDDAS